MGGERERRSGHQDDIYILYAHISLCQVRTVLHRNAPERLAPTRTSGDENLAGRLPASPEVSRHFMPSSPAILGYSSTRAATGSQQKAGMSGTRRPQTELLPLLYQRSVVHPTPKMNTTKTAADSAATVKRFSRSLWHSNNTTDPEHQDHEQRFQDYQCIHDYRHHAPHSHCPRNRPCSKVYIRPLSP